MAGAGEGGGNDMPSFSLIEAQDIRSSGKFVRNSINGRREDGNGGSFNCLTLHTSERA